MRLCGLRIVPPLFQPRAWYKRADREATSFHGTGFAISRMDNSARLAGEAADGEKRPSFERQ